MLSGRLLSFVIRSAAKTSKAAAQTIKLIYSPLRWRNIYAISSLLILFWVSKSFWKLGEYWKWIGYISTVTGSVSFSGPVRYSGGGGLSAAGPSPPGSPVVIEVGLKPYKIDELK